MTKRVCVVGAGPAGLVATKTLIGAGLDVDCFELSPEIGGHWVIDNPSGRSAAYESLCLNTTRAMSRLSDFEMPADDAHPFPTHEETRAWLHDYVDHFGFAGQLHLATEVVAARPRDPSGWTVTLCNRADGSEREESYDALLACSGNYWSPKLPELVGDHAGERIHALEYRSPSRPCETAGRNVVVVGIGNTGCELACEIAKAGAASVSLSARSGTWIMPKWVDGKPAADSAPMMHPEDTVPGFLRFLPEGLRARVFEKLMGVMFRRMFGDRMDRFVELGLPQPPADPLSKRATVCDPLMESLESGAVVARPAIDRFEGHDVVYEDGSRERADVVIYATGYHLRYPYLPEGLVDTRDEDLTLFHGTMHPARPDLFVVGVSRPTGSFWPIAEVHARLAASLLSGRYRLPSAREIGRRSFPILGRRAFNPALYGLAVREEIARGERRAKRHR